MTSGTLLFRQVNPSWVKTGANHFSGLHAHSEARGLSVESDPSPFPEHVVVRFDGCSRSQVVKNAKHLTRLATARGWQHQAESEAA